MPLCPPTTYDISAAIAFLLLFPLLSSSITVQATGTRRIQMVSTYRTTSLMIQVLLATKTVAMDTDPNMPTANAGCISCSSSNRNESLIEIQPDDVLYGKGKDVFNHRKFKYHTRCCCCCCCCWISFTRKIQMLTFLK